MVQVHKKRLIFGFALLILTLYISQIKDQTILSDTHNVTFEKPGSVDVTTLHLFPGDEISIQTSNNDLTAIVSIYRHSTKIASSGASQSVDLSWVCWDEDDYTFTLQLSNAGDVEIAHTVTRSFYHHPWVFTLGVVISGSIVISSMGNNEPKTKLGNLFNVKSTYHQLFDQLRRTETLILLLLFMVFLVTRISLNIDLVHNDEIGGGKRGI